MKRYFLFALVLIPAFLQAQIDNVGPGRAVQFGENGGYINIGDSYNDLTFPFTISSWVYLDPSEGGISAIFASEEGDFLYRGFWLRVTRTNIGLGWGDGTGGNFAAYRRVKAAVVEDFSGKWVHVSATASSRDDIDLYLNGVELASYWTGSSSLDMAYGNPDDMTIGKMYTNGENWYMRGFLDEIRLWNYVRTQEEIRRDMCRKIDGAADGLIGYWNLDETEGEVAYDQSNTKNDGARVFGTNYPYSGAPIGDTSIYVYGDPRGLEFGLDGDTVQIKNLDRPVLGMHIYAVKSDGVGFGECQSDQYLGVYSFTNSIQQAQVSVTFSASEFPAVGRNDNSVRTWSLVDINSEDEISFMRRHELVGPKPSELDLGDDLLICDDIPLLFQPDLPNGEYRWSDGTSGPEITIRSDTTVWLEVVTACSVARDTVAVSYATSPKVDIGPDLIVCPTDETRIQVTSSEAAITWVDGTKAPSFLLNNQSVVWAEAENICGVVRDSVVVQYSQVPIFTEEQIIECVTLPIQVSVDAPSQFITWSNGVRGSSTQLDSVGIYYAYYNDGCFELEQRVEIRSATDDLDVFIPNVFTPNNDGKNEYFIIDEKLTGSALTIYNRWGKKIYYDPSYNNSWRGENLAAGNYFYKIQHICDSEPITGWLHVIK